MLETLHIENIAVVERADVRFASGLNVLTGETGAGKSIIIDSLGAVLGGRVNRSLVRAGESGALVSAVFISDAAACWCRENGIEPEDGELILQRRIGADGKSSCRICGVPTTAAQLRELGLLLADIHGQNDGRRLLDESTHRAFLDAWGAHEKELSTYKEAYRKYDSTRREAMRLSMDESDKERLRETLSHQIAELEAAALSPGEREELESRRDFLRNYGKLSEVIDSAYEALYTSDYSAISMAAEAASTLKRASGGLADLEEAEKLITDARIMLEDAAERLLDLRGELDFSPEEYDAIESRISDLRRLMKKYGEDETELVARLMSSRERLDDLDYADDRLIALESKLKREKEGVLIAAEALTAARKKAADGIRRHIVAQLNDLSMPGVDFLVDITKIADEPGFDESGADEICFLMSANAGEPPGRISIIASGGELSRVMLAMKNTFAEKDEIETLVFDEIDAGVSGIAAQRVGEKLAALSLHKQVLCVTHLPQIAAMADTHFVVQKTQSGGRTYTELNELEDLGREGELARLHGGENVTETTLRSAREQLKYARIYKETLAEKKTEESGNDGI